MCCLLIDAVRIALNVTDVEAGILRELCEQYQANFDEVLLPVFLMWTLSLNAVSHAVP